MPPTVAPSQRLGVVESCDSHDQPGFALTGIGRRADQRVVHPRVVTGAAPPSPALTTLSDSIVRPRLWCSSGSRSAMSKAFSVYVDVDPVNRVGVCGFPSSLHRHHRDAVLIADPTAGTVVGHCDRFAPARSADSGAASPTQPTTTTAGPASARTPISSPSTKPTAAPMYPPSRQPISTGDAKSPTMIAQRDPRAVISARRARAISDATSDGGHHDPGESQGHVAGPVIRRAGGGGGRRDHPALRPGAVASSRRHVESQRGHRIHHAVTRLGCRLRAAGCARSAGSG